MRVGYGQIESARDVNFIDFLSSEYPEHIAFNTKTKEYFNPAHDSIKFYPQGFYRFSNGKGGDGIRYLMEYIGLKFPEAVAILNRFDGYASDVQIKSIEREKKYKAYKSEEKEMPKKSPNNIDLLTYLINERGIDRDTVDMLLEQGVIYQDTRRNVVFINDKTDFAVLRGTVENFKQVWKPGNGYWCFSAGEDPQEVFITEAPIDAISLYILRDKAPGIYCAMGGLKPNTLERIIVDYPKHNFFLAPDWDDKGKKFKSEAKKHSIKYLYPKPERLEKAGFCKDWNELLLASKK